MSNLDLMRKRIQHNQKKQEEDYEKEMRLRLARKGVVCAPGANSHNSSSLGEMRISNKRIQNYIEERGIQPICETIDGVSYYLRTPKLLSLLESYEIENYIIKNRL